MTGNGNRLDLAALSAIERIEIRAGILADGMLAGIHPTARRGSCPEFREFRDYRPGDAIRDIDWRASARNEKLQLRIRDDESAIRWRLVLDISRSLDYRGRHAVMTKFDYARTLTAALLILLGRQGDAIGLTLLGRRAAAEFPPTARRSGRWRMFDALDHQPTAGEFGILRHLEQCLAEAHSRSLMVILSDFYLEPARLAERLAALAAHSVKVLLFQILDDSEMELEWDEPIQVSELEGEGKLIVHPDERREGFRRAVAAHLAALRETALANHCEYALFRTSELPVAALGKLLHARREYLR